MNFLPVGHTHEDVDKLFSRIGDKIQKSGSGHFQVNQNFL